MNFVAFCTCMEAVANSIIPNVLLHTLLPPIYQTAKFQSSGNPIQQIKEIPFLSNITCTVYVYIDFWAWQRGLEGR